MTDLDPTPMDRAQIRHLEDAREMWERYDFVMTLQEQFRGAMGWMLGLNRAPPLDLLRASVRSSTGVHGAARFRTGQGPWFLAPLGVPKSDLSEPVPQRDFRTSAMNVLSTRKSLEKRREKPASQAS